MKHIAYRQYGIRTSYSQSINTIEYTLNLKYTNDTEELIILYLNFDKVELISKYLSNSLSIPIEKFTIDNVYPSSGVGLSDNTQIPKTKVKKGDYFPEEVEFKSIKRKILNKNTYR